ncbi:MAG: HTH-type transcriptional repressor ComR [Verrucomicrobiota bacterium]
MDELATELGMSKKTLYVNFRSKDEIMQAVLEQFGAEVRSEAEALFANRRLNFAEKLHAFAESMIARLARLHPSTPRELQRFAPHLHQQLMDIRQRNIPFIFGRFIEEGQQAGKVRPDIDKAFAIEFFLQAMQGLMQSGALERHRLAPRDLLPRAIDLFFGGLLTPAGRKEYEKLPNF